jgi:mono/diheme cytochrome c family protein
MRRTLAALALAAGLGGAAGSAGAAPDYEVLPKGKGRELVFGICNGCHSVKLVVQQGMTRPKWDDTLTWMVEQQGMPELQPEIEKKILDYLATHFGPDRGQEQRRTGGTGGGLSPYNTVQPMQSGQ